MYNLRAVFWDLDGTLADTELTGHRLAFNSAFKFFNLKWKWDIPKYIDLLRFPGGINRILAYSKTIGFELSHEKACQIHTVKKKFYLEYIKKGNINLRIGVDRIVKQLNSKNIQQWVVTTSSISTTTSLINKLFKSSNKFFNGLICSEDVSNLKPNPEAYLLALNKSGCSINNSLVLEDSLIGLKAAKAANLKCLVTPSPWLFSKIEAFAKADLIVDHLGDISLPSSIFKGSLRNNLVDIEVLEELLYN